MSKKSSCRWLTGELVIGAKELGSLNGEVRHLTLVTQLTVNQTSRANSKSTLKCIVVFACYKTTIFYINVFFVCRVISLKKWGGGARPHLLLSYHPWLAAYVMQRYKISMAIGWLVKHGNKIFKLRNRNEIMLWHIELVLENMKVITN